MGSEILYTLAQNKDGNLIKAKNAEKGKDYYCPKCKNELILKKSGNTGRGSKRQHFAHRTLTPNCTPESALHYNFKTLLADKIKQYIERDKELIFIWECKSCYETHSGNLLKKATSVKVEHNLTVCQPDISLFDKEKRVFAVIEIVVTHRPEEKVVNYYKNNNIVLIQIEIDSEEDLDCIQKKVSTPNLLNYCINPKCKKCGRRKNTSRMYIIDSPCRKCKNIVKIALIERSSYVSSADSFSKENIEIAKSNGVILQYNKKYLACTCKKCGTFVYKSNQREKYYNKALYEELPSTTIDIGYHCGYCFEFQFITN